MGKAEPYRRNYVPSDPPVCVFGDVKPQNNADISKACSYIVAKPGECAGEKDFWAEIPFNKVEVIRTHGRKKRRGFKETAHLVTQAILDVMPFDEEFAIPTTEICKLSGYSENAVRVRLRNGVWFGKKHIKGRPHYWVRKLIG